jgi:hypothetical protein
MTAAATENPQGAHILDNFKIDCDESDLCLVCFLPAIPHIVLNCGHALCKTCAERVHTCPSCRALIQARTPYHQMSERIRGSLRYECSDPAHARCGCTFVGNFAEAKRHAVVGKTALRFHDAFPQLTYAEIEAVVKDKEGHDTDGMVTELIELSKRKQPTRANVPTPAASLPVTEATLFWDYDNVNPRFLNVSVPTFVADLRQFLRATHGINVRDSAVYLVAGKEYGNVPEKLSALQMRMRLCSAKREAADRELSGDMRTLKDQAALLRQSISVVLVSSDKDFIRDVKDMTDAGHRVFVIHNAEGGSDHTMMLGMYATAAIAVNAFLLPVASVVPSTAPLPPPSSVPAGRRTVRIANNDVDVALLVPNNQVSYLLDHPHLSGALCRYANVPGHDAAACKYVHYKSIAEHTTAASNALAPQQGPKPSVLSVDGVEVPVGALSENAGLSELLRRYPRGEGRWCRHAAVPGHDVATCGFIHRAQAATTRTSTDLAVLRVEGRMIPIDELVANKAVEYLRANPTRTGKWCSNTRPHDAKECAYLHLHRGE